MNQHDSEVMESKVFTQSSMEHSALMRDQPSYIYQQKTEILARNDIPEDKYDQNSMLEICDKVKQSSNNDNNSTNANSISNEQNISQNNDISPQQKSILAQTFPQQSNTDLQSIIYKSKTLTHSTQKLTLILTNRQITFPPIEVHIRGHLTELLEYCYPNSSYKIKAVTVNNSECLNVQEQWSISLDDLEKKYNAHISRLQYFVE